MLEEDEARREVEEELRGAGAALPEEAEGAVGSVGLVRAEEAHHSEERQEVAAVVGSEEEDESPRHARRNRRYNEGHASKVANGFTVLFRIDVSLSGTTDEPKSKQA